MVRYGVGCAQCSACLCPPPLGGPPPTRPAAPRERPCFLLNSSATAFVMIILAPTACCVGAPLRHDFAKVLRSRPSQETLQSSSMALVGSSHQCCAAPSVCFRPNCRDCSSARVSKNLGVARQPFMNPPATPGPRGNTRRRARSSAQDPARLRAVPINQRRRRCARAAS